MSLLASTKPCCYCKGCRHRKCWHIFRFLSFSLLCMIWLWIMSPPVMALVQQRELWVSSLRAALSLCPSLCLVHSPRLCLFVSWWWWCWCWTKWTKSTFIHRLFDAWDCLEATISLSLVAVGRPALGTVPPPTGLESKACPACLMEVDSS